LKKNRSIEKKKLTLENMCVCESGDKKE